MHGHHRQGRHPRHRHTLQSTVAPVTWVKMSMAMMMMMMMRCYLWVEECCLGPSDGVWTLVMRALSWCIPSLSLTPHLHGPQWAHWSRPPPYLVWSPSPPCRSRAPRAPSPRRDHGDQLLPLRSSPASPRHLASTESDRDLLWRLSPCWLRGCNTQFANQHINYTSPVSPGYLKRLYSSKTLQPSTQQQ